MPKIIQCTLTEKYAHARMYTSSSLIEILTAMCPRVEYELRVRVFFTAAAKQGLGQEGDRR